MDDSLFHAEKQPVSAEPENKTLRAMKHCFEENATTLKQVHANLAYNPHTRGDNETHTSCCAAHSNNAVKGNLNITPMWDAARMWEGKKRMYAEVPLTGKGMYVAAYVRSGGKKKVYLANNLLMLTKDKENEEIHYYVVTALADLSKYNNKEKRKKLFQFVGNADFEGIVIFSKTNGTFVKAMHVHDGKSHPIFFGHTHALPATRSQNGNTDDEGTTLTLTSQFSNYDGQETGEGVQGEHKCTCSPCLCIDCPGNKVYCAICGEYYDINLESCPNNCDVTITPGDEGGGSGIDYYVTCSYCLLSYNPLIYNECPQCANRCSVCGYYPCICPEDDYRCERCGSRYCPGPAYCGGSSGGGGGGEGSGGNQGTETPEPIAPKAKKLFRNSNMTDENWGIIERMLDKIIANCMGEALYNGLINFLNGKTLIVQFTNKNYSAFTFNGSYSGISIGLTTVESNALFHEMWHAYQAYHESESTYLNSLINQDIEAHYAQYLYLRTLPEYEGSKWKMLYDKDLRHRNIKDLNSFIDEKGNIRPNKNIDELNFEISSIASIFEISDGYNDPNVYKYDPTRNGLNNFSNLKILTKDC